jgi:FPC/CPF motif-containing protein YcgG
VIFAAPTEGEQKGLPEYHHDFWEMLRNLHILDTAPWPADIPQDTNHQKWTFCFDGTPVFPVAFTPVHERRWSRHAPVHMVALQPKWVLDNLLRTPEKRESATAKVRKLLESYDQVEISPDLTSYGVDGTSEARQLCLWDENDTAKCPYTSLDKGSLYGSTVL